MAGGAAWVTGSYDPETRVLYFPTGNPFPDTDGDERVGTNLYANWQVKLGSNTRPVKLAAGQLAVINW